MIFILETIYKNIIKHCLSEYPSEAVGLIAGEKNNNHYILNKIFKGKNIAENKTKNFLLAPYEQLKFFQAIEKNNSSLLGIYHSHIDADAVPSLKDIKQNFYQNLFYFIINIEKNKFKELNAFKFYNKNYRKINYKILEKNA